MIITVELYHRVFSGVFDCFRYAAFQAASILTTTGYATADYQQWPYLPLRRFSSGFHPHHHRLRHG